MSQLLQDIEETLAGAGKTASGAEKLTAGDRADDSVISNYSLEGLNIKGNVPLAKIVTAVKRFRSGEGRPDVDAPRLNILLSGPSGAGKTAFVRYIACQIGAPLHVVRASDLLSKWVGESEKGIARVFREAREKNAILFLDEADSFLQKREGDMPEWEVSRVNELLCQMETAGGCLVCSTNFKDSLDSAAVRRFCFKIEFDYLTDEGKDHFFQSYFKTPLTKDEADRLHAIDRLVVADYRTVRERLFFISDGETNAERLEALEQEVANKEKARATIGF